MTSSMLIRTVQKQLKSPCVIIISNNITGKGNSLVNLYQNIQLKIAHHAIYSPIHSTPVEATQIRFFEKKSCVRVFGFV